MEKVQYHTIRDDWRMNEAIERIRVREVLEPLELSQARDTLVGRQ